MNRTEKRQEKRELEKEIKRKKLEAEGFRPKMMSDKLIHVKGYSAHYFEGLFVVCFFDKDSLICKLTVPMLLYYIT